jgi:hypothetical protein
MAGTFAARIEHLQELVGVGPLEAKVTYDQVYAVVMETGHWDNYRGWGSPPEGEGFRAVGFHSGGPHFLRGGLYDANSDVCQRLADHVLDDAAGALIGAMSEGSELICTKASSLAPIEFGDLRESDHAQVFDDGALVYDRPAPVGRLSSETLKAKRATRSPRRGGSGRRTYLPPGESRHGTTHPHYGGHEADRHPTVDHGHHSHEPWEDTNRHYRDRGLPYRVPSRTDPYALHRNKSYDRDEADSWGEWTDAEYARERKANRFRSKDPGAPKTARDRLLSWAEQIIEEDF